MKGISVIIATIILVVITIGLVATAYVYISGLITARTRKSLSLVDSYCVKDTNYKIYVYLKNEGTADIDTSSDLTFLVDGKSADFESKPSTISAGSAASSAVVINGTDGTPLSTAKYYEVRVISPGNVLPFSVGCGVG